MQHAQYLHAGLTALAPAFLALVTASADGVVQTKVVAGPAFRARRPIDVGQAAVVPSASEGKEKGV